jgi:P27 family predicted phage terminase small subunit
MGALATSDRGIMTAYCCAWAVWIKAHRMLRTLGEQADNPEVLQTEKGNMIQSPWLGMQNRALADVVKYGSFLGLDPTSRTRIKLDDIPTKSLREELMA